MDEIGTQTRPPLGRVFGIAARGIRNRLGRSLVTLSGVALGIAFLMSAITIQLINKTVDEGRDLRAKVSVAGKAAGSETDRVYTDKAKFIGDRQSCSDACPHALSPNGDPEHIGAGIRRYTASPYHVSAEQFDMLAGPDLSVERQVDNDGAKSQKQMAQDRARLIWIVAVSLCVTVIGVANALLMSVTERFREIGTMKCLGALSASIRLLFMIEASIIGFAGSVIGVIGGAVLTMAAYSFTFSFGLVFGAMAYGWLALAGLGCVVAGTLLSMIAALYPARLASRMIPASALRSTV